MTRAATLFASSGPTIGVEVTAWHVSAAAIADRGGRAVVTAHASEPLPPGVVAPGLNATNVSDRAALVATIGRLFERLSIRPKQIGLILPDSVAKVSLVRFDKVPTRAQDLDQIVRWQVRKTAPFRIEDAQVSYAPGAAMPEGGREFVVALARRDIIEEYEAACLAAGAHAGIVDLATFNVINAVLASGPDLRSDWLLVHVTSGYTTVAIVRGADLIFFRNRPAEEEGSLADLVHQTAMYYEDRLQGAGFSRVFLVGATSSLAPGDGDAIRRNLEERLGTRVESVDPRSGAALTDRISAGSGLLDTLAPLVGLLLRERAMPTS